MKFVDAEKVREMFDFKSKFQVYEAARRGHIPCVRIGRKMRFSLESLRDWADKGGSPIESEQQPAARAATA